MMIRIGVTYPPENLRGMRRFTRKLKLNYPVVLGTEETKRLLDELQ